MINTSANVINLVALLSGIHAYFVNQDPEIMVTMEQGDPMLFEGIILTSSVARHTVDIKITDSAIGELIVGVWLDGTQVHELRSKATDGEDRRALKEEVIAILSGRIKFE